MSLPRKFLFLSIMCLAPTAVSATCLAMAGPPNPPAESRYIEANIYRLAEDPRNNQPVVLLSDPAEERVMPIWIGPFEAGALNSEMLAVPKIRPQTHDLLESIIREAGLEIQRVLITHQEENIYYATILIEKRDSIIEVDSRPSDAMVMAVKFNAPIFVSAGLFSDKSIPLEKEEEDDEDPWYEAPGQSI